MIFAKGNSTHPSKSSCILNYRVVGKKRGEGGGEMLCIECFQELGGEKKKKKKREKNRGFSPVGPRKKRGSHAGARSFAPDE